MRRTALLAAAAAAATAALGAVIAPPALADSPWAEPAGPTTGFAPYDMVSRMVGVVTAARESLAEDQPESLVEDLVFRIEYLEKDDTLSLSNSSMTFGLQSTLLFSTDSAELSPKAGKELGLLAEKIASARPREPVEINGYTDNRGSAKHGLTLSDARADAIKKVMRKKAPGVKFEANGFGEKDPVANNGTPEGRKQNRRVEIVVPATVFTSTTDLPK